jgi:hypothetical protein
LNIVLKFLIDNDLSFIGSAIFAGMAGYLLLVALNGNATYGYRSACFTFYPFV